MKKIFIPIMFCLFGLINLRVSAGELCKDFDAEMNIITIDCATKERIYTAAEKEEKLRKEQETAELEKLRLEETARLKQERQERLARAEQERQAREKARQEKLALLEKERQEKLKQVEEWRKIKKQNTPLTKQQKKEHGVRGSDFFLRLGGYAGTETTKSDSPIYTINDVKSGNIGGSIGLGMRFYGSPNYEGKIEYYVDAEGSFSQGSQGYDKYLQSAAGYYLTKKLSLRLGAGIGDYERELSVYGLMDGETQKAEIQKAGYKLFGGLEYELSRWLNLYAEYSYVSPISGHIFGAGVTNNVKVEVSNTGYISLGLRLLF